MAYQTVSEEATTARGVELCHTPVESAWFAGPSPGQLVGEYILGERIGRGGLSFVYRARHTRTGEVVALKLLRAGQDASEAELRTLDREIEAARRLSHPGILPIRDAGTHRAVPYIALPLLTGGSLEGRFRDGSLGLREGVAILAAVARAVQAAHEAKVIHRDLKPGNILLDQGGRPLVADFGLARFLDAAGGATRTGDLIGSLPYMSPEQAGGTSHRVGAAGDLWPIGVMLYELLTGERPFHAPGQAALTYQIRHEEPPPPSARRAGVPAELERICLRCLRKEPAARPATAAALADELERWLTGAPAAEAPLPARASRRRWLVGVAALMGCLLCGALALGLPAATKDPQSRLRQSLARAAPGRPAELLEGPGHPLAPPRTLAGRTTRVEWLRGEPLHVEGMYPTLVELLPPDPKRGPFRLTVELQHNASTKGIGRAGFYVGREDHLHPEGTIHTSALVGFVDPVLLLQHGRPHAGPLQPAILCPCSLQQTKTTLRRRYSAASISVPLGAPPGGAENQAGWFVLTVEVNGDAFVLRNGAAPASSTPTARLRDSFADTVRGEVGMVAVRPTFPTTGGVGLYIDGGTLRVRRATFEPLNPR